VLITVPGDSTQAQRNISRRLLGWHFIPPHLCYIPARDSVDQPGVWSPATADCLVTVLHRRHDSLRSVEGFHHDVDWPIITLTQVIFCDIVPLRQRPKYFPLVLGAWSVGSILGPVSGGILTEHASWRWCFHINYPFCGIGLIVAVVFVRLNRAAELTLSQKLKQTDWTGAAIFVGGMTSFLVGLSWGGVQHPWKSTATLAPIIAGLLALVLFAWWQCFARPHSLLPISIFRNWSAIAAFYCALVNGLVVSICHHIEAVPG
jgi:MFS family permease